MLAAVTRDAQPVIHGCTYYHLDASLRKVEAVTADGVVEERSFASRGPWVVVGCRIVLPYDLFAREEEARAAEADLLHRDAERLEGELIAVRRRLAELGRLERSEQ